RPGARPRSPPWVRAGDRHTRGSGGAGARSVEDGGEKDATVPTDEDRRVHDAQDAHAGPHDAHAGPHEAHAAHAGHDHHGHGGHGDHGDHAAVFRDRFWINLVLTLLVVWFSPMVQEWFGYQAPTFP